MSARPRRVYQFGCQVGVATIILLAAGVAEGQQVKPYVMLLFDTSGSMRERICGGTPSGDYSIDCPSSDVSCSTCDTFGCGDGIANDSRLWKVKKGAFNVVAAFGEVTFGLARFHQTPVTFACSYGGWYGAPDSCNGASMGTSYNRSDVLVTFAENNPNKILNWMNFCSDWSSSTSSTTIGTCWNGTNAGRPPTNACSLCTDCGAGCDFELRGEGYTPLAGSMYWLRTNYLPSVVTGDTKKTCRPYKVILLTDGQDNCPGNPVTEAGNLFSATNNLGKSIPVHVIGFAASSLQSYLNQIAVGGGTGSAIMVDNEVSLALAMANIISESILKEKCNNADDDCNDLCDEAWPEVGVTGGPCTNKHAAQSCSAGVGVCYRTGTYVCKTDQTGSQCSVAPGTPTCPGASGCNAQGEICGNGLDDDCDGAIDEGCVPCVPQPEICDGKDNNCNGLTDEGYTSVKCGSNIGECKQGDTACVGGVVVCNGAAPPSTELCDNKDNNCDTITDNFSETCYPAASGCNLATGVCLGVCKIGSRYCAQGAWTPALPGCAGFQGPTAEVCNGLDDDCDGTIDDGVSNSCIDYGTCLAFTSCGTCPPKPQEICDGKDNDCNGQTDDNPLLSGTPCGSVVGECKQGAWACESAALVCKNGTGPKPEICDGKDNDCNGTVDDNVPGMGGVCGVNLGECTSGVEKCIGGKVVCVGSIGPQPELCDGKDNNCDGTVDNGLPQVPCGLNVGECKQGLTGCIGGQSQCVGGVGPAAELCDGKDNDCDGLTDDAPIDAGTLCGSLIGECKQGTTSCLSGKLECVGGVGPTTEICDGKDNDCDGTADNNIPGIGNVCGVNKGECKQGKLGCTQTPAGGWALTCAGGVSASAEICDGKDNDCDGETDEDYPEKGKTCGVNVGECKAGNWACATGKLDCVGGVGSTPEICDGKDNDCNGAIDDKVPGEGQPCGGTVGECKGGTTKCLGGKFMCVGGVGPQPEICDAKDNNCDGKIDENAECPGASACVEGQCLIPCTGSEFSCPGGSKCINSYCVPDKCSKLACKPSERCSDGKCVEKCASVTCTEHQKCEPTSGKCIDDSCYSKGCPSGETCVGYVCVKDPCPPGHCPADKVCIEGQCYDSCLNTKCSAGEVCSKGKCVKSLCEGYPCDSNYICKVVGDQPRCEPDPCRIITCTKGQICRDGACIGDPCATVRCPEGTACEITSLGEADCRVPAGQTIPKTTQLLASGGGGCACTLAGTEEPPLWAGLILGLLALARRLRRARSKTTISLDGADAEEGRR